MQKNKVFIILVLYCRMFFNISSFRLGNELTVEGLNKSNVKYVSFLNSFLGKSCNVTEKSFQDITRLGCTVQCYVDTNCLAFIYDSNHCFLFIHGQAGQTLETLLGIKANLAMVNQLQGQYYLPD